MNEWLSREETERKGEKERRDVMKGKGEKSGKITPCMCVGIKYEKRKALGAFHQIDIVIDIVIETT